MWHSGLLAKLKACGISENLLQWFKNYLENRRQRVVLPGTMSNWAPINAGVPQGSILGPLLFLVYINDIVANIQSNIRLFADDTSLYLIVDHAHQTAEIIQSDIIKITEWAKSWLVTFNPSKTESLLISRKKNKPHHPTLNILDTQIEDVTSHKHLGVYLSNDGNWHSHIEYIRDKA